MRDRESLARAGDENSDDEERTGDVKIKVTHFSIPVSWVTEEPPTIVLDDKGNPFYAVKNLRIRKPKPQLEGPVIDIKPEE